VPSGSSLSVKLRYNGPVGRWTLTTLRECSCCSALVAPQATQTLGLLGDEEPQGSVPRRYEGGAQLVRAKAWSRMRTLS
jgi:hypothetical protein